MGRKEYVAVLLCWLVVLAALLTSCSNSAGDRQGATPTDGQQEPTPTARQWGLGPAAGRKELVLSDFDFLRRGMGIIEIESRVGGPSLVMGSGLTFYTYFLVDGGAVELRFDASGGLFQAIYHGVDGNATALLPAVTLTTPTP